MRLLDSEAMMVQVAQLNLDEPQSLFIADAICVLAGIITQDPACYNEAAKNAARSLMAGHYTQQTVDECVALVEKLAETWEPGIGDRS
jgi:hypothetical protein